MRKWIGGRGYPELFEDAFGSREITTERIVKAIASYERGLVSLPGRTVRGPRPRNPKGWAL